MGWAVGGPKWTQKFGHHLCMFSWLIYQPRVGRYVLSPFSTDPQRTKTLFALIVKKIQSLEQIQTLFQTFRCVLCMYSASLTFYKVSLSLRHNKKRSQNLMVALYVFIFFVYQKKSHHLHCTHHKKGSL